MTNPTKALLIFDPDDLYDIEFKACGRCDAGEREPCFILAATHKRVIENHYEVQESTIIYAFHPDREFRSK